VPSRAASPGLRIVPALALAILAGGAASPASSPGAPQPRSLPSVVIVNGEAAIGEAIVTVALPRGLVGESFVLRPEGEEAEAVTTQILRDRTLAFTVRDLAPGEVRRLRLEPALDRVIAGGISVRHQAGRLDVALEVGLDGQPVLGYRTQPSPSIAVDAAAGGSGRGGYLHPLRTPAGRAVTGDDDPRHPEQRGVWSAWGAARFDGRVPDFWHTASGRGAVEFEGVLEAWGGPLIGGFRARHRAVDRTVRPPVTAETETWVVTVPAVGRTGVRHRLVDLAIAHEVVSRHPLVVAAAAYGGLGLRGPAAWRGGTGMAVITSEGRPRTSASRTRPRWVAAVGLVGGANAGIAVLDHPDNFRHPQPLFVDAGQPFLSLAPMQIGAITLAPQQELVLRYRLVTFDGWPDRAWLERQWQAYAHPPRVAFVAAMP
jgi:hypothetical protein